MSPLDTDDWKLSAHIMWRPKRIPKRADCDYCSGTGKIGGGFKSFDGPEDCPRCFGTGKGAEIDPLAPEPPIPPELVQHMRKAWEEFFAADGVKVGGEAQQNEAAYQHDRAYTDGMVFARQCIGAPTTMEKADEALRKLDAVIQRRHAQEAEYRAERRNAGVGGTDAS